MVVLVLALALALWLRYTGPDTTPSSEIMLDILRVVVIGTVLSGHYFPTGVVGRLPALALRPLS